jgi:hypothetical protein
MRLPILILLPLFKLSSSKGDHRDLVPLPCGLFFGARCREFLSRIGFGTPDLPQEAPISVTIEVNDSHSRGPIAADRIRQHHCVNSLWPNNPQCVTLWRVNQIVTGGKQLLAYVELERNIYAQSDCLCGAYDAEPSKQAS